MMMGYTWAANGWDYIDSDKDGYAENYYFDKDGYLVTSEDIENEMWIPNTGERWNQFYATVDENGRKLTKDGEIELTYMDSRFTETNRQGHNPPTYFQFGDYMLYEGYTCYIGDGTVFDFEAYKGDDLYLYSGYRIPSTNVLAAPVAGSAVIGQIPDSATVVFYGNYKDTYALVYYQGIMGFVPIDNLSYYESQD